MISIKKEDISKIIEYMRDVNHVVHTVTDNENHSLCDVNNFTQVVTNQIETGVELHIHGKDMYGNLQLHHTVPNVISPSKMSVACVHGTYVVTKVHRVITERWIFIKRSL